MSSGLIDLLGRKLVTNLGTSDTSEALAEKGAVALFFSAQWYPPSQTFTPQLVEWYHQGLKAKGLEVVLVSSDHSEESFDDYLSDMPWFAIPFTERERCRALTKKFKVTHLPHVVILNGDGRLINRHGRAAIAGDPTGLEFPWRPKSCQELLAAATIIGKDGAAVDPASLDGKVLGLYFGGQRSPPCRDFSPKLADWYARDLQGAGLEVIFVSAEDDEASFREYYKQHPWLAIDLSSKREKEELALVMDVKDLPTLVILDQDRSVVTKRGVEAATDDPAGALFPWHPKPVVDLAKGPSPLNDGRVLVALCEACSQEEQAAAEEAMAPAARRLRLDAAAAGEEDPTLTCVIAKAADAVTFQLRAMMSLKQPPPLAHKHPLEDVDPGGEWVCDSCGRHFFDDNCWTCSAGCDYDLCAECHVKLGEARALPVALAIVDMDANVFYKFPADEISSAAVEAFVRDYEGGTLVAKPLRK